MKKNLARTLAFSLLLMVASPVLIHAYTPGELIVCDGVNCGFSDLVTLVQRVITVGVELSTIIVVIGCIMVGFKSIGSSGNATAIKEVKDMLGKLLIGYGFILTAWLIVYTITSVLLNSDAGYTSLLTRP